MTTLTKDDWHTLAGTLQFKSQAFINGEFVNSATGHTFSSISPIDGKLLTDIACCGEEDVDLTVKAARRAFEDGRWSGKPPAERKKILPNFADIIRSNRDELASIESLDMGKPISDSTSVDVRALANCFDWHGESIDKVYDEIAPTAQNAVALITKQPLGVVAGGQRARTESGGCYVEPTIFDNVENSRTVAQQEIFGPMVSVIPVKNAEETVKVADDTCYGLASAVWTDDLATAHKVSRSIRAGMVYVNCYDSDDMTVPFGGFKESGIGRDKSLHALDKYTELKTTWINIGR